MFVPFGGVEQHGDLGPQRAEQVGRDAGLPIRWRSRSRSAARSKASPATSRQVAPVGLHRASGSVRIRPSSCVADEWGSAAWSSMSASSSSSVASSTLRPATTTFSPLSGAGLCEAETMIAGGMALVGAGVDQARRRHDAEVDDVGAGGCQPRGQRGGQHLPRASRVAAEHHAAPRPAEPMTRRHDRGRAPGRASMSDADRAADAVGAEASRHLRRRRRRRGGLGSLDRDRTRCPG